MIMHLSGIARNNNFVCVDMDIPTAKNTTILLMLGACRA